ncbi:MAG: fibronectin type III domain-containing protein [Defluviitaleaceae bacterium]|nr:fibronectin type III domain-containing protein [Defluviitaleaceae bacterium]MCL2273362.1 fibronectin type III domain-containing protein [Defluviitaleaceae bacterium]
MKMKILFAVCTVLLMAALPLLMHAAPAPPVPNLPPSPFVRTPVTSATVVSQDNPATATESTYNLRFSWSAPMSSSETTGWRDPSSTAPPNPAGHISADPAPADAWSRFASRFDIEFANRSLGGAPPLPERVGFGGDNTLDEFRYPNVTGTVPATARFDGEIPPNTRITNIDLTRNMRPGSLYEINIIPDHFVPIWNPPVPQPPGAPIPAFYSREPAPDTERILAGNQPLIFMTDILIRTARGSGEEVLLEWTNPQWEGQSVFPHWQITLRETGTGGATLVATINTEDATPLEGGRWLRYVITTDSLDVPGTALQIGSSYMVSIEPMRTPTSRVRGPSGPIFNAPPPQNMPPEMANAFFTYRDPASFPYAYPRPVLLVPQLSVSVEGANFVRLMWSRMAAASVGYIVIEQWAYPFPDEDDLPPQLFPFNEIARIPRPMAQSATSWVIGQIIPPEARAFSIAILDANGNFLARSNLDYFIPGVAGFTPYSPDIEQLTATVTAGGLSNLQLTWRAFTRAPYTALETAALNQPPHALFPGLPPSQRFIDLDLHYRVFVSNTFENLNWPQGESYHFPPVEDDIIPTVGMLLPPATSPRGIYVPLFRRGGITQYTRLAADGFTWEEADITANGVYFVRIEAVRTMPGRTFISQPSFGVIYIPPEDDLVLTPEMIDAPPLRGIVNEPGQMPQITLNWDLRYLEIGDPASAPLWNRWHASVGVDTRTNSLVFGRSAQFIPDTHLRDWNALNDMLSPSMRAQLRNRPNPDPLRTPAGHAQFVNEARQYIGSSGQLNFNLTNFPMRIQDMYHRHYRIHVVRHSQLMAGGGDLATVFEAYRDMLMLPANDGLWTNIGRPEPSADGTSSHSFTTAAGVGALQANTTYVVFLQPYEPAIPGQPGRAFFPNYVIVTTPDEFEPAVPVPTTPILFVGIPPTDNTISVRWRVQEGINPDPRTLFFELRWSESLLDYPEGGTLIPWEELEEKHGAQFIEWIHPTTLQVYHHFTIENLFPDTVHHVWARAFNVNDVFSGWSNPVEIRTRDIAPPPPPRLGLASNAHLQQYNLQNDTQFAPMEEEAINFFLGRVFSDFREHNLPRATGGVATGGNAVLLNIHDLEDIYAIRFSELLPNRHYYARARTILTITRGQPRSYTYEIQLADNFEFLDAITFIIPPLVELDPINMRRAESPWVYIEVSTTPGGGDHDGAFRPEQFPLPDDDWEITYDNGTLQFRFRTNRTGADGRPDQQVDQRFISRLIDSRTHRFEIDLSEYFRRPDWPVENRVLEIPLSIMRAFNERRITLAVNFGDITVEIPPGAFETAAVRNLQMGLSSFMRIEMQTNAQGTRLPELPMNNVYVTLPQQLVVTAATPQRSVTLTEFAQPINIQLQLNDIVQPDGVVRASLFFTSPQQAQWQDAAGMRTQTRRPVTVAAVSREAPRNVAPADPSRAAMERVTARLTFTDLFEYNPRATVSAEAFNNVMLALANNRASVTLNAPISNADRQSLARARFEAPASVTWEQAVDILIRFYELRTRRVIQPMTTPQMVTGINNATPALQQSILKAADIGFISGTINPHGALTMGDLMVMLDIVIMDTDF